MIREYLATPRPCWAGASLAALCISFSGCGSGMRVSELKMPSGGAPQSADPDLAVVGGSGDLALSWIEGDGNTWSLYTARSADGGEQWSPPVRVAGGAEASDEVRPHGESSPLLLVGPRERMALVWPNSIVVPGRKWPAAMLRFSRSEDGGQGWSTPITLNDDTTGAPVSHQFHGATLVGDSGLTVAWLDERDVAKPIAGGTDGHAEHAAEPDATIYMTTSSDFGRTWGPNRVGWRAACPCCRVSLARNPQGQALAAWRKHFPGNVRDVVKAVIGDAPSAPERVHPDDWAYPGCPHTGPAVAAGRDGGAHVVWYNGKPGSAGMYYVKSTGGPGPGKPVGLVSGPRVGPSHPAVVELADGGALAGYDLMENGERRIGVARVLPTGVVADRVWLDDSDGGKYPQLAVLGDTLAVVAWTQPKGDGSEVRLARVHLRD
jgi:hypothetical protein